MGDPKRQRKKYETPRNPWSPDALSEELRLIGEYGLRNKKELWRAAAELRKYRKLARSLFTASGEARAAEEARLLQHLNRLGLLHEGPTLDDVLRLSVRDFLERRLQTAVHRLGLAKTQHQARQFIVHGHVLVGDRKVRSPSYHLKKDEDEKIRLTLPMTAA